MASTKECTFFFQTSLRFWYSLKGENPKKVEEMELQRVSSGKQERAVLLESLLSAEEDHESCELATEGRWESLVALSGSTRDAWEGSFKTRDPGSCISRWEKFPCSIHLFKKHIKSPTHHPQTVQSQSSCFSSSSKPRRKENLIFIFLSFLPLLSKWVKKIPALAKMIGNSPNRRI